MGRVIGLVALLAALACSGSGSTLSGAGAFSPNTEIAGFYAPLDDGGPDPSAIIIEIAHIDQGSQSCTEILGAQSGMFTGQIVSMLVTTGDGTALRVGHYPVVEPQGPSPMSPVAALLLGNSDAGDIAEASAGSVTVTEVGQNLAGSFTTTLNLFDGGAYGMLSGSFSAANCGPLYSF